ncbi:MAG: preprotein translocase subunit SecE [Clostridia bacterium]|nr:preprotein translocase subunit SecE [Clostridia bacterium]
MADEKTVQKKADNKPAESGNKFVNFFKNLPANIARPFRDTWHELKKVTWPSKKDLINYTLIVLAFIVFMGVVIGLLDLGSSELVKLLINI